MKSHMAAAAGIVFCVAAFVNEAGATAAKPDAGAALHADIDKRAAAVEAQVVAWRRDIHQHPELGNRETRTAKLVADHLTKLGLEVQTGVGVTGVVGVLKGGKPGPRGGAARRHGRAAGDRAGGRAVRLEGEDHLQRRRSRRDARLRPRQPRGDPDGHRRGARRHEGDAARHREVHLPARGGGPAGRRGGRCRAHDQGGRPREPGARCDLRPARVPAAGRARCATGRTASWRAPTASRSW